MNRIIGCLALLASLLFSVGAVAQEKIVNPEISYAGTPRSGVLGGIAVSGVEGYEDYMLASISGLTVGQKIELPGQAITDAVKRYWKHGLFSKVQIAADSIVGDKIYLHFYLALRPRVSTINYIGVKKSEREDLETKLGLLKGSQITPNMIDRAELLAKNYFDDKGYKNAEINIQQRDDVANKNQVILDVIIDKKEKMKVRQIIIEGNNNLSDSKIRVLCLQRVPSPRLTRPVSWTTYSSRRNTPPNAIRLISRILSTSIMSLDTAMPPSLKTACGMSTTST